jgi:hypothetical protein
VRKAVGQQLEHFYLPALRSSTQKSALAMEHIKFLWQCDIFEKITCAASSKGLAPEVCP